MSDRNDLARLADEFVLGLLDPEEHAEVDARLETDPALRALVAASRDRFLDLDLAAKPADVSADLWSRIEDRLSDPVRDHPSASPRPATPANDNGPGRWRATALASLAASVVLAVGLGWSLLSAPEPKVIAVLLDEAGTPLALVEDYGDASARVTPLVDFDVPAGHTMQVWTLPSPELGPVSLGLLPGSDTTLLDGPALPAPKEDQLYEITVEQAGGSPTGRPTGPILVKGFAKIPR